MTRALIWLMPLYVLAFTALGALFGPHRQHASVPTAAVIAAGTGALLFSPPAYTWPPPGNGNDEPQSKTGAELVRPKPS